VVLVLDKVSFLTGLKNLLRYHQVLGLEAYRRELEINRFLRFYPVPRTEQPEAANLSRSSSLSPTIPPKVIEEQTSALLQDLVSEVSVCAACSLHESRLYPVPGRGPNQVRLLIVGDWLTGDSDLPPGHLFGVEQDQMLARMLSAIHLSPQHAFISNVIKCAVPEGCEPGPVHIQACTSFLRRQIELLQPEIICTMGATAMRAVLAEAHQLSRLRGRVHTYATGQGKNIPVIVTYHPTFLLKNPEMKTATWADLQLLAQTLKIKV